MNRSEALKELCKIALAYMPTSSITEVIAEAELLLKHLETPKMAEPVDDLCAKWTPEIRR